MYEDRGSEEVSVIDVVLAVWRGKIIILGATVFALILGAVFASLQKDRYQVSIAIQSDFDESFNGGELLAKLNSEWSLGANWRPVPGNIRTVVKTVSEEGDVSISLREVQEAIDRLLEEKEEFSEIEKSVITEKLPYAMRVSDPLVSALFSIEVFNARLEAGQIFGKALGPEDSELTNISMLQRKTARILLLAAFLGFGLGCFIVLAGHAVTNYRRWKKASVPV